MVHELPQPRVVVVEAELRHQQLSQLGTRQLDSERVEELDELRDARAEGAVVLPALQHP